MTDIILPEGWIEVKLGDILDLIYGKALPNKGRSNHGFPVYGSNGIIGYHSEYIVSGPFIIVGRKGSFGEVRFSEQSGWPIDTAYYVKPKINNNLRYVYYFMKTLGLNSLNRSTAIPGLNRNDAYSCLYKFPPIAEQEEIAQRVDRAIGHVDELKSRLETLLTTLKTFRQSVLNAAVTGKLTENWTVAPLKELTIKIGSGSTPKGGQEVYKTTGIPLIRSMNIHFDKIKFEDLVYIDDKQADKLKNVTVKEDDVLLNITGASIGRVNIAPVSLKGARVNQHVSILRCKLELLFPNFLKTILSSTLIQNWINNENYGATRQALTKSMIENLEISFPPLEEQEEIVKRVEAYFALADQIEKQVQSALDKVNLLTQSILAKAFRGELTKEWRQKNPELISGENSAEALLKRIKAEKDALEKPSKKTKNTKVKVT